LIKAGKKSHILRKRHQVITHTKILIPDYVYDMMSLHRAPMVYFTAIGTFEISDEKELLQIMDEIRRNPLKSA